MSAPAPVMIRIASIQQRVQLRPIADGDVLALVESIREIGLQTPVSVVRGSAYADGEEIEAYDLVAGAHRVEACRRLGHETIAAFVLEMDDVAAHMWRCDENLARSELDAPARAVFTAERRRWYEIRHPETRHGGDRRSNGQVGHLNSPASFTADTARKTGRSERDVRRDARRGAKIAPDVLGDLIGDDRATGKALDAIARLPESDQREAVERIRAGKPIVAANRAASPKDNATPNSPTLQALIDAWTQATKADRRAFLAMIK